MPQLVVFDLDGTLVDSRRDLAESVNVLLDESGAQRLPEEDVGRMVGSGVATLVARAFAAAGLEPPAGALDRFLTIYDEHLLEHTRPYPRIPDVLAELERRAMLALLTNKPLAATRRLLAGLDLARFFRQDGLVAGDGPFGRKPDPAGLRHLMARASATPSDTTLVGDSLIDWRTAQNASTRVCLVRYGFGFETLSGDAVAGSIVVESPDALLRVL